MAQFEELIEAVDAAIIETAKAASKANNYTTAEHYSSAVRQLAEARAWIHSPGQSHGGASSVKVSG